MYERYGLNQNPFRPVEPLEQPPHFLSVEGFGEQRQMIDDFVIGENARGSFFLIYGVSGTGRTSVANYVAATLARGSVLLPVVKLVKDSAHKDTVHEWMEAFAYKATLVEHINEIQGYFDNIGARADASVIRYVTFLNNSLQELMARNRRLVAIFENVTNPELLALAQEVFDPEVAPYPDFPLVIFTSSDESVQKGFANLNPRPAGPDTIQLRSLTGQDVLVYISEKWQKTGAPQPHPFDAQKIVMVFDKQQYPLRRVIQALDAIFEEKVRRLGPGGNWPTDDSLLIGGEDIAMPMLEFIRRH